MDVKITRKSTIERTARVMQLEGMFDLPPADESVQTWNVSVSLPESWNVGLIVGQSGAGKSTVARELFGNAFVEGFEWDSNKSLLDGFPSHLGIKDITEVLSSVGFSSPPKWVRPFHVLSNGEQFRVTMARALLESNGLCVVDEFTSVIDRTVAQIGSHAIAKTVRRRNQQFVAVTCHYDVIDWLEPDWIYEPQINRLTVGRERRRPPIELEVRRVHSGAWSLFREHHYLDTELNHASACFVALWQGVPVAFCSVLNFPHPKVRNIKREHRLVCLPDFQGVGIGNRLSALMGAMCKGMGWRYTSTSTHPALIRYRNQSKDWEMVKSPSLNSKGSASAKLGSTFAIDRLTASFEYCGQALDRPLAERLWS